MEKDIEQIHFAKVMQTVEKEIELNKISLEQYVDDYSEMLQYASETFYEMDDEEIATTNGFIEKQELDLVEKRRKLFLLSKVEKSPYFGKIDFTPKGSDKKNSVYVGLSNISEEKDFFPLVCDWRAPISSMYYDYELGEAKYNAPEGEIEGTISAKRQFKIKDKKLEFYFDSNLTIMDNILKETLAQNTDDKMRNIVSTIQKEQNKIIRSTKTKNLLVQGVAGSGKTSIALHRTAYLLYNTKNLTAADILIISPNAYFSEYISDVLPELGENNIVSLTFHDLARKELESFAKVEARSSMLNTILEQKSERIKEVQKKASFEFYDALKEYLKEKVDVSFEAKDIKIGGKTFFAQDIDKLYSNRYYGKEPSIKIDWICDYILEELKLDVDKTILLPRVRKILLGMFRENNIVNIYKNFLESQNMKFEYVSATRLKSEDVAPVLYIKKYLIGIQTMPEIKYLLIDEMQDYSPIQLDIVNYIFSCGKIILGDINQCFERKLNKEYLGKLLNMFEDCELIELKKSYRSTEQISKFANKLIEIDCEFVSRRGDEVEVIETHDDEDQLNTLAKLINENVETYNKVAVVCKTRDEAEKLYFGLSHHNVDCTLGLENTNKKCYIISTTDSKGLEFDYVIIPNVDQNNYNDEIDKNILYISSTRALHKLSLCYHGTKSKLIEG